MTVTITGDRTLALKFDQFPDQARAALEVRITQFIDRIAAASEQHEPVSPGKTGRLRSEIKARVYTSKDRIAGYVSIYAPGMPGEYAKAAALEYGSDKPRHVFQRASRMTSMLTNSRRRMVMRVSKPVHLKAYRYLRGPFDDMLNELNAALAQALEDAVAE